MNGKHFIPAAFVEPFWSGFPNKAQLALGGELNLQEGCSVSADILPALLKMALSQLLLMTADTSFRQAPTGLEWRQRTTQEFEHQDMLSWSCLEPTLAIHNCVCTDTTCTMLGVQLQSLS